MPEPLSRDPRIDPQPGDALLHPSSGALVVGDIVPPPGHESMFGFGDYRYYEVMFGFGDHRYYYQPIAKWRDEMKDATILYTNNA